ncbi:MAG: hypothetical protein GC154_14760 [bacterium]|nr:hypothetical protein [bacterium]
MRPYSESTYRLQLALFIALIVITAAVVVWRRHTIFKDFAWRTEGSAPDGISLLDKTVSDKNGAIQLRKVTLVHAKPKVFTLTAIVNNNSREDRYIGMEASSRGRSRFLTGAAQDADILTMPPNSTATLESDFILTSSLHNDVALRIARCGGSKVHIELGTRFLPDGSETLWEKEIKLPQEDADAKPG